MSISTIYLHDIQLFKIHSKLFKKKNYEKIILFNIYEKLYYPISNPYYKQFEKKMKIYSKWNKLKKKKEEELMKEELMKEELMKEELMKEELMKEELMKEELYNLDDIITVFSGIVYFCFIYL